MSTLIWDAPDNKIYEYGVDRGVLYVQDKSGIAWNGLVSVNEKPNVGERSHLYFDGVKTYTSQVSKEYEAVISAYTYPDLFSLCDGSAEGPNGLLLENQPRLPFSFSYRTKIGSMTSGEDAGYKLHIVYNAKATVNDKVHSTVASTISPTLFSWNVYSIPEPVLGFKDSAHLIIDSREANPTVLAYLESRLYGTEGVNPQLPTAQEIYDLFGWEPPLHNGAVNILGTIPGSKTSLENLNAYPSFETLYDVTNSYTIVNMSPNPNFAVSENQIISNNPTIYPILINQQIPEHPQKIKTGAVGFLANLVPKGGFEDGTNFEAFAGTIRQHPLNWAEGSYLAFYTATSATGENYIVADANNQASVLPNTTYELSAKARRATSTLNRLWALGVDWYDSAGVLISSAKGVSAVSVPGGDFTEIKEKFTSPTNAAKARIKIFCTSKMAENEAMFFDAFRMYRPSAVLLSAYNLDGLGRPAPSDRIVGFWLYINEPGFGVKTKIDAPLTPIKENTWIWVKPDAGFTPAADRSTAWVIRLDGNQASFTSRVYITGVTTRAANFWHPEAISGDMVDPLGEKLYSWQGLPNKSPSQVVIPRAMGTAVPFSVSFAYPTSKWSSHGSKSLYMRSSYYYVGSAYVDLATHGSNFGVKLARETEYTILALCRVEGIFTSSSTTVQRSLSLIMTSQESSSYGTMTQAPNVPGTYLLRHKFSIPASATAFYIRLYHGGTAEDPGIFWDGPITVVEGNYEGPPFDGDSEVVYKNQRIKAVWSSVSQQSPSFLNGYKELEYQGNPGDAYIVDGNIWVFSEGAWTNYGPEPK